MLSGSLSTGCPEVNRMDGVRVLYFGPFFVAGERESAVGAE